MLKEKIPSFIYLLVFLFCTITIIVIVAVVRLVNEVNSSNFKNNSFSLLIVSKDSKFIYVDKNNQSALFLALGDIEKYVKGKNTVEATFSLGIPINSIVYDPNPAQNLRSFTSSSNELKLIFNSNIKIKNANRFDMYKLVNAVRDTVEDNRKELRVNLFDEKTMKKLDNYFTDSVIRNSGLTIEIDNGTGINGLGNLLSLVLSKQGYNVISVRTAKSAPSSYIAYHSKIGVVVDSLRRLTGFPLQQGGVSPASDITIFLGDDVSSMLTP